MISSTTRETESEPEEHSLSLSQHSSPSQSDQEQTPAKKVVHSVAATQVFPLFKQQNQVNRKEFVQRNTQDFHFLREQSNPPNSKQHHLHFVHMDSRHEAQHPATEQKPCEAFPFQNLVGADIRGKIDGAFDSGYLMTAIVNGKIFRGVLFAPGPDVISRTATSVQNPSPQTSERASPLLNHISPIFIRHQQQQQPVMQSVPRTGQGLGRQTRMTQPSPVIRSDLQGVVLTLGGPGSGDGGGS
ncbi:hypothetical protein U1Q18_048407 [Sarracenia purpurea var. burkii]